MDFGFRKHIERAVGNAIWRNHDVARSTFQRQGVRQAIYIHDAIKARAGTFVVARLWRAGIGLIRLIRLTKKS